MMNVELQINKEGVFVNLPCGCKINYETRELIKACEIHGEDEDE